MRDIKQEFFGYTNMSTEDQIIIRLEKRLSLLRAAKAESKATGKQPSSRL